MFLENIQKNIKSGITVSLISIPLSISLAVASGTTPVVGIITAIWAGIVAALLGGSHFNIVGPTGALSGMIATYALTNGAGSLPMLAITTGLFVLAAYVVKLERYLILIPSSVIHGFTLGVAFIIGLGQLNYILGLQGLTQHERFVENIFESLRHLSSASVISVVVFLICLLGLFLFKKFTPKFPGAIVLAPLGILFGYLAETQVIPLSVQTLGGKFGDIAFHLFESPSFVFTQSLLQTAAVVALIAILETMLSAKIADGMTHTKYNERKELIGLGFANIVSGLFGGIPATAALARTSLNIKTGATHRTSGIISTVCVAIISVFFLATFKYIPMPVIGGILVFVAIQMIEMEHYLKFWRYEKSSFFVSLLVAIVVIFEDPIIGILLGVSLSLLLFVNRLSHGQFDLRMNRFQEGMVYAISGEEVKEIEENADVLLYSIRGKLCYINSRAHVSRFQVNLQTYKIVVLRLREVYFMDLDGVEALDEIVEMLEERGQEVLLTSLDPNIVGLLEQSSKSYQKLKAAGKIFQKTNHALVHLGVPIEGEQP